MGGYYNELGSYFFPIIFGVLLALAFYGWLGYLFARKTPFARRYLSLTLVCVFLTLLVLIFLMQRKPL